MTRLISELDIPLETFDWSLRRYQAAIEVGILKEDDRIELIRGQLIHRLPSSEEHAALTEFLAEYFMQRLGFSYRYRTENPVPIPDHSQPEPDFVIANKIMDGLQRHHPQPEDIHLVIEVAKTTLDFDRRIKGPLYAEAGLPEFWAIDVNNKTVEVHTSPQPGGRRYTNVITYGSGQSFLSPFLGQFEVDDLRLAEL